MNQNEKAQGEKEMDKTYNIWANEALFKLSDIYNQEQIHYDNFMGENLFGKCR